MKISELIKKLNEIKEKEGDLDVYYFPFDWITPAILENLTITEINLDSTNWKVVLIGND